MRVARNRPEPAREERDEHEELVDAEVPAAVVCAHCGDAECSGCLHEQTRSGVVAIVPWERPGAPALTRLWATARATTLDSERFFESLPDGPLGPAFKFAVTAEVLASSAMVLLGLAPIALLAPGWARHVVVDEGLPFTRLLCTGIPMLAGILVAAHTLHGFALERGARRSGAKSALKRALRFGLYAAGWDLVFGPIGVIVVALKEGPRAGLGVVRAGSGLPTRSARAFLRGCYRLEGDAARPALLASYVAAGIATAVGAVAVIAALLAALFA
jgi:hypothetical protein